MEMVFHRTDAPHRGTSDASVSHVTNARFCCVSGSRRRRKCLVDHCRRRSPERDMAIGRKISCPAETEALNQGEMAAARTTQDDVARAAGVHRTTVSLALKRHPRIPGETQERVCRIADQLGYVPDPMLSSLVAYRTQKRPEAFHGTLAWLVSSARGFNWQEVPHFPASYAGAHARPRRCGLESALFDLSSPDMTAARPAGILRARNISGLLLCPQRIPRLALDFPWQTFSTVTFGYGIAEPKLHPVSPAHYLAVRRIMDELRACG